jgi:hypothetical protein
MATLKAYQAEGVAASVNSCRIAVNSSISRC